MSNRPSSIEAKQFGETYSKVLQAAATNASIASEEGYELNIDDLIIRDPETTLRLQIETLSDQWRELDEKYLEASRRNEVEKKARAEENAKLGHAIPKLRGRLPSVQTNQLAIPMGEWLKDLRHPEECNVEDETIANHPRIPENHRQEYLEQLRAIFCAVPKRSMMTEIPSAGRGPPHLLRFKALMDGDERVANSNKAPLPVVYYGKLGGDWLTLELENNMLSKSHPSHNAASSSSNQGVEASVPMVIGQDGIIDDTTINNNMTTRGLSEEHENDRLVPSDEVILTFSVHHNATRDEGSNMVEEDKGGLAPKYTSRSADYELLGSQTLFDLHQMMTNCLLSQRYPGAGGLDETYFFIEGVFYVDSHKDRQSNHVAGSKNHGSSSSSGGTGAGNMEDFIHQSHHRINATQRWLQYEGGVTSTRKRKACAPPAASAAAAASSSSSVAPSSTLSTVAPLSSSSSSSSSSSVAPSSSSSTVAPLSSSPSSSSSSSSSSSVAPLSSSSSSSSSSSVTAAVAAAAATTTSAISITDISASADQIATTTTKTTTATTTTKATTTTATTTTTTTTTSSSSSNSSCSSSDGIGDGTSAGIGAVNGRDEQDSVTSSADEHDDDDDNDDDDDDDDEAIFDAASAAFDKGKGGKRRKRRKQIPIIMPLPIVSKPVVPPIVAKPAAKKRATKAAKISQAGPYTNLDPSFKPRIKLTNRIQLNGLGTYCQTQTVPRTPPLFSVRCMRSVTVGSLPLTTGLRYLYRHHLHVPLTIDSSSISMNSFGSYGSSSSSSSSSGYDGPCREVACEHFVYLTDVRLHSHSTRTLHSSSSSSSGFVREGTASSSSSTHRQVSTLAPRERDLPWLSAYPRCVFQAKVPMKKCFICKLWGSQYEVHGDRLADRSPAYMCRHCYYALHYSPDGQLLYDDFAVVPHLQSNR